ncbi:hypothetical protein COCCU_06595 [Corynebacterium occultum]|uniref:Uncharacterized protein n=1 Tax=Corynebacterium occultum TaxID=2675219 RepID=A0A6B8W5L4_9CORY|nr:hypothetical protein [Corynebacterium occultum]QGU07257.1 hypothetical protein COCCU_06595 [Corynebacterium occultum]
MHTDQLEAANTLHSDFLDAEGINFGYHLPAFPILYAEYVASQVRMFADQKPTVVYIAHGLKMDRKWDQVQSLDEHRGARTALLQWCHLWSAISPG